MYAYSGLKDNTKCITKIDESDHSHYRRRVLDTCGHIKKTKKNAKAVNEKSPRRVVGEPNILIKECINNCISIKSI